MSSSLALIKANDGTLGDPPFPFAAGGRERLPFRSLLLPFRSLIPLPYYSSPFFFFRLSRPMTEATRAALGAV